MKNLLLFLLCCGWMQAQKPKYQDDVHLKEIPKHNLSLDLGIQQPLGNYGNLALSGTTIGLGGSTYFNKHWGISGGLKLANNVSALTNVNNNERFDDWRQINVSLGSVYSHTLNRFQIDIFLRGGISFIDLDDSNDFSTTSDTIGPFTSELFLISENSKDTAVLLESGVRFNYYFRRSVQLFFSPQFSTTLNNPLLFKQTIDQDQNTLTPEQSMNISNLVLSVGIKIALSPQYSNGNYRVDE